MNKVDKDPDMIELLSSDSRYFKHCNVVDYNGQKMYDIPNRVTINDNTDNEYLSITSKYQNRYDKVSYDKYENPKYWWVIADINNVTNPFDLNINVTLRIPPLSKLVLEEVI